MQFNVAFIASAVLVATAAPGALGADFAWFAGANCTGAVIARNTTVIPGECVTLANGGSAKSIGYSGVLNHVNFYRSDSAHDFCSNDPAIVTGSGSGCATGPDGYNLGSFEYFL